MEINLLNHIAPHFDNFVYDVFEHKYTHYVNKGGRNSTKSSATPLTAIALLLSDPTYNMVCLRKYHNTVKKSVYNKIKWAITKLGIKHKFKFTLSPLQITYIPTGQTIYFTGCDDPDKIKSIAPEQDYIAIVWYEELAEFSPDEITSTNLSFMRGGEKFWVFYTYNPPKSRDNWVNVEMNTDRPDRKVYHSTYLDVPKKWVGSQVHIEAEACKKKSEQEYKWVYLGLATGTGGAVFENIESRTITEEEINGLDYFYYGLDFGFAIDPLAWCKLAYSEKHNKLWVLDEIYQPKLNNFKAVELIKAKLSSKTYVTADSAEPRTINEFNNLGLNIIPAKKGKDSVDRGVKWLQDLDCIVVDPKRTPNAHKEFTLYEYDVDRNGNYISRYPDKNNHYLDACRYAMENIINQNKVRWL